MGRFLYRPKDPKANENGMVPAEQAAPQGTDPRFYVISDEMDATRHMGTGELFTSKAKFRQRTRDIGCVEVGNDPAALRPRKPVALDRGQRREDIRRAIHELRERR